MDMHVQFGPLPEPFRAVIELAERSAHLTYANAINHGAPEYDAEAQRAHERYTELCHQVAVCYHYHCFERTMGAMYCDEHRKEQHG